MLVLLLLPVPSHVQPISSRLVVPPLAHLPLTAPLGIHALTEVQHQFSVMKAGILQQVTSSALNALPDLIVLTSLIAQSLSRIVYTMQRQDLLTRVWSNQAIIS